MTLHGQHLIADQTSAAPDPLFHAFNPATGERLEPAFAEATEAEVDRAFQAAARAFERYGRLPGTQKATFLEAVADEILALGDVLIERAGAETGLPADRLTGERGRTVNQARLFAEVLREGSWVSARIDRGDPARAPVPKPDLRRMLVPLGPVAVFGASNFPLAFSVAGGDTVSALAAGCPVVVKAHPAHPGTCELVGEAIRRAVRACGLPPGVFSMVHGQSHAVGLALVTHRLTKAVGFTGSLRGGRALFDAAAARPEPIPVYAEMGSTNPVFVLPGALRERSAEMAAGYVQSVNLGVGQFCTNPGLMFVPESADLSAFLAAVAEEVRAVAPASMLHAGIRQAFVEGAGHVLATVGVDEVGASTGMADTAGAEVGGVIFRTDADTFERHPHLREEVFGPSSLVVVCPSAEAFETMARTLEGHLTATIHGTEADLEAHAGLIRLLEDRVGRLNVNGFPTGVEVCAAMQHGGPYPATTDSRSTSVGTAALLRFARPLCYQNFPEAVLPEALREGNPLGIWRLVDGAWTQA